MEIGYILIWAIIWGLASSAVGRSKNINGFWWGFLLGLIGFIIVCCMKGNKGVERINVITPANKIDKYEQLEKLHRLKENGAISAKEYEEEKKKLMVTENDYSSDSVSFCSNCGTPIYSNDAYCPSCGGKIK